MAREVKAFFASRGESARNDYAIYWPRIFFVPDWIVGCQLSIDTSGLRLEGRSVEGEHGKPHNLDGDSKWVKLRRQTDLGGFRDQVQV